MTTRSIKQGCFGPPDRDGFPISATERGTRIKPKGVNQGSPIGNGRFQGHDG